MNFELLLIDDGSSDGSGAICDFFANNDSRIRVFHTNNRGVSYARNLGLTYARGSYVMFVDSDDELPNNAIESLISETADFTVGGMFRIIKKCGHEFKYRKHKVYQNGEEYLFFDDALPYSTLLEGPGGKLFRMSLIRQNGLMFNESLHYGEDKLFVYTYLLYAKTQRIVTDIVYIQKRRKGSLSSDIASPIHVRPLIDFLIRYVDIVKVYQKRFSCKSVEELFLVDVIKRYVFRYLRIVRMVKPRMLSSHDLKFISSLLKDSVVKTSEADRSYIKICVWIGRFLPDSFLYGFIYSLNSIC